MENEKDKATPLSTDNWNDVELRDEQKPEFEKDPGKESKLPPSPEENNGG